MASLRSDVVQRHLQTLFNEGVVGALTDAELLDRFITRRGEAAEAAFATLVERHAPMVLATCRQLLGECPRRPGRLPGGVPGARQEGPIDPDRPGDRRLAPCGRVADCFRRRGWPPPDAGRTNGEVLRWRSIMRMSQTNPIAGPSCTLRSIGFRTDSACRSCSATSRG